MSEQQWNRWYYEVGARLKRQGQQIRALEAGLELETVKNKAIFDEVMGIFQTLVSIIKPFSRTASVAENVAAFVKGAKRSKLDVRTALRLSASYQLCGFS